jgi:hypothetical protein
LPECAYFPGVENYLQEAEIRWFIVDAHGVLYAEPRPAYGVFAPVLTPNGIAAFARDLESARQVWSRNEGYPGDPRYRDFYRDVGFDLDLDYVRPYLPSPDLRGFTGLKYFRITGPTPDKEVYDRALALAAVETHAAHFLAARREQARKLGEIMDRPPLILAPYDAELFGHARNYPNAGMPERAGLVGEADTGTLFLDEIGELPEALQAHLLRLMDAGEYQRLGEPRSRRADVRIIAATNRPREHLKADFLARFRHVIEVPPLRERREDLPLLVRHLLRKATKDDPRLFARFMADTPEGPEPRVSADLIEAILRHPLTLQVRELDALLWRALAQSTGDTVDLSPAEALPVEPAAPGTYTDPADVTPEALRAALAEHGGVQEKVWRGLGLQSRYVLRRLLKKHDLEG